jgi:hypothetical protein
MKRGQRPSITPESGTKLSNLTPIGACQHKEMTLDSVLRRALAEKTQTMLAIGNIRQSCSVQNHTVYPSSCVPFAPSPLRDFFATMDALTPVRLALRFQTGNMNSFSVPDRSPCFTHLNFRSLRLQPPPSLSMSLLHVTLQLIEFPIALGLGFTIAPLAHQD